MMFCSNDQEGGVQFGIKVCWFFGFNLLEDLSINCIFEDIL